MKADPGHCVSTVGTAVRSPLPLGPAVPVRAPHRLVVPLLWVLAACNVGSADPVLARILMSEPLTSSVTEPQRSHLAAIVPPRLRPWLPPADVRSAPYVLPIEKRSILRVYQLADRPEVAVRSPDRPRRLPVVPTQRYAAPDPSRVEGSAIRNVPALGLLPARFTLPAATTPQSPRRLPSDGQVATFYRPTLHPEPIPTATWPSLSLLPVLPVGPLSYGLPPDPVRSAIRSAAFAANTDRLAVASDPTEVATSRLVLVPVATQREQPAPFLALTIPDPFQLLTAIPLRRPIPDADPLAIVPAPRPDNR